MQTARTAGAGEQVKGPWCVWDRLGRRIIRLSAGGGGGANYTVAWNRVDAAVRYKVQEKTGLERL